jgi:hypothetical protein
LKNNDEEENLFGDSSYDEDEMTKSSSNPVGELQELMAKQICSPPTYNFSSEG